MMKLGVDVEKRDATVGHAQEISRSWKGKFILKILKSEGCVLIASLK
jgi:hypothetical protein